MLSDLTSVRRPERKDRKRNKFKVAPSDTYRLIVQRSQAFNQENSSGVTEKDVVEAFVQVVGDLGDGLSSSYKADLLSTFERRSS
jgi:hypothetical protein